MAGKHAIRRYHITRQEASASAGVRLTLSSTALSRESTQGPTRTIVIPYEGMLSMT
jgi:hypothetical protein